MQIYLHTFLYQNNNQKKNVYNKITEYNPSIIRPCIFYIHIYPHKIQTLATNQPTTRTTRPANNKIIYVQCSENKNVHAQLFL